MKRFQVYPRGSSDDDVLVILDFGTIPEDEMPEAEREAYEMALTGPVWEADSIEEVCDEHPQLAGFEPWIWVRPAWEPQGMNRDWLLQHQQHAARNELTEYLRRFVDTYGRYVDSDDIRGILEQVLSESGKGRNETPGT